MQVLAFRLALSLYVFLHNASAGPRGGSLGARAPNTQRRGRECPKKFCFAHYMYGNGLVEFGVFWGVSMDHTTAILTDQIRKRVCLAL